MFNNTYVCLSVNKKIKFSSLFLLHDLKKSNIVKKNYYRY